MKLKGKWYFLILGLIFIVLGISLFVFSGYDTPVDANTPDENSTCISDSDCIPASCCHPTSCTNKINIPKCENMICTQSCESILDCGAGSCKCVNNNCEAVAN